MNDINPEQPPAVSFYDAEKLTAEQAARLTAHAQGCTCDPAVAVAGVHVVLQHDTWCALLRKQDVN